MSSKNHLLYSVVVPVFNSESSLKELFQRIKSTFESMSKSFEVIFVNDCSRDNSIKILNEIYDDNKDGSVIIVDLYNNFGQQNALMCGFKYCNGDFVITIDDDLQNPPEEIGKLISKIDEGYDAVYGSYNNKKDKVYKNFGSILFRKLNHKIFNVKNNLIFTSFRIIKIDIVKQLINNKTSFPYISGMLVKITKNIVNVNVNHNHRGSGESNYNFSSLVSISLNLIINHSTVLLKLISNFGLFFSLSAFFLSLWFIYVKFTTSGVVAGWTTIVVLLSFYNAIILITLFIIGIYLSRLLKESSNQKQYAEKSILK